MGDRGDYYLGGVGGQQRAGGIAMDGWPSEVPSHWDVYFEVDDHDAAAKRAVELGATDMSGAIEVPQAGTMHYMADPTGAFFYIMQSEPAPEE
jgi:hypothetical protein